MFSEEGYRALTVAAGFVVRADHGVLRVSGAERAAWLQGLLTNDVLSLPQHDARYAAYLTPHGRMISDMRLVALADALLLEVPRAVAHSLAGRLDALIFAEDVQVTDQSEMTAIVEVYGPDADAAIRACQQALGSLGAHVARDMSSLLAVRMLYVTAEQLPALRQALRAADLPEVSADTLDVLRIETGIPKFLVDMDQDTIPLEAGIEDRAISFNKGCYVGQEIIVRVTQRGGGRVAKRLVGLLVDGVDVPPAGAPIVTAQREIGRVTSATRSPALARTVALGYVHRDFVQPGTRVQIPGPGERTLDAVVASLPFVSRALA